MYWSISNDARKIRNGMIDFNRDSYDINKAAKDIADKTLKKGTQNSKKQ